MQRRARKVKYIYLYQTKENENRRGEIAARSRADAYAALRKEGIRPYRLIGDDPVRWQPWAALAAVAALAGVAAFAWISAYSAANSPLPRRQLEGRGSVVSDGMASEWDGVFSTKLDRYLAAYAQPGWIALPPEVSEADVAGFADELKAPLQFAATDEPEVRTLKRIVANMRREMEGYLATGGSVRDYMEFLDDRQDQEREYRNRAADAVLRAPESMRERTRKNVNTRLREMGLSEI